ncbi:MAG: hypothetical protein GY913_27205 [Proteobacteria bacterium]|nr:hypothetical protein [Pseudomonadota bacterium]MCP4920603.1 hypothetical protein [Pseudomonadota bacterium]
MRVLIPGLPGPMLPPFRTLSLAGLPPHRFLVGRDQMAVRIDAAALGSAMMANANFPPSRCDAPPSVPRWS